LTLTRSGRREMLRTSSPAVYHGIAASGGHYRFHVETWSHPDETTLG
jgi:hypothetical protein